jgi:hypothetical protein
MKISVSISMLNIFFLFQKQTILSHTCSLVISSVLMPSIMVALFGFADFFFPPFLAFGG